MSDVKFQLEPYEWVSANEAKKLIKHLREEAARLRVALKRIVGCHGEDECGVCGSLRIAKEALGKSE